MKAVSARSTSLESLLGPEGRASLPAEHEDWLVQVLEQHGGMPSLQVLWALMDEAWVAYDCDPRHLDERVDRFYRHPVWLLNTLFIEQDPESLEHRRRFAAWAARQQPCRVADVGGGGGTLARAIAAAIPAAQVDIIEPHPHPAMVRRLAGSARIAYIPQLRDRYDVLVATDVFEHVGDPLEMLATMLAHLRPGGRCLIANCFQPVIACHLPQLFHWRHSWDAACAALGLRPMERVAHARAYEYAGPGGTEAMRRARAVEERSRRRFALIERLPPALSSRWGGLLFRALP